MGMAQQPTTTEDAPTEKNDLYAFLGEELTHDSRGRSRGTLVRVRAAYDFCEFEVPGGKTVKRDCHEVFQAIENGYTFETQGQNE